MSDTAITADSQQILDLTTEIVAAYVGSNPVSAADLPGLIVNTHTALVELKKGGEAEPAIELVPAVPLRKSITPEFLVCLEDGKKFKSLRRHLASHHDLTPEQYRAKWKLPQDYPMTAPSYSATRSALAKANGLGRKPAEQAAPAAAPRKKLGLKFQ